MEFKKEDCEKLTEDKAEEIFFGLADEETEKLLLENGISDYEADYYHTADFAADAENDMNLYYRETPKIGTYMPSQKARDEFQRFMLDNFGKNYPPSETKKIKPYKTSCYAVTSIITVCVIALASIVTVNALKGKIAGWIIESKPNLDFMQADTGITSEFTPPPVEDYLSSIPQGYTVSEISTEGITLFVKCRNADNYYIDFSVMPLDTKLAVDNEDIVYFESVELENLSGIYYQCKDRIILICHNGENVFIINSNDFSMTSEKLSDMILASE